MRSWWVVCVLVSGCYSPDFKDCVVACRSAADCAPTQVCGAGGLCAVASVADSCGLPDAMPRDARTDAPASACVPAACIGAGGTCRGGRCEIDPMGPGMVTCPGGMPCTVICDAKDACKGGVRCGGATDCIVECDADSACQDRGVDCGDAETCTVLCRGPSACQHGEGNNASVECRTSTCNVTCDGSGACQDGIDVDPTGTCTSHCCQGACQGGIDSCANDAVCT